MKPALICLLVGALLIGCSKSETSEKPMPSNTELGLR